MTLYKVCPLCRGEGRSPWAHAARSEGDPTGVLAACACSGRGFVPATAQEVAEALSEHVERLRAVCEDLQLAGQPARTED